MNVSTERMVRMAVASRLNSVDRAYALAVSRMVRTPNEARRLAGKDGWTVRSLDNLGRVYALTFRGCESRIFFHRQFLNVPISSMNGAPVPAISHSEDAEWLAIDLLHDAGVMAKEADEDAEMSRLQKENFDMKQMQADEHEHMENQMVGLMGEINCYKVMTEKAAAMVVSLRQELTLKDQQMDQVRKAANQRAELAAEEKAHKVVAGMFVTVQNLWRARTHWAQDDVARNMWDAARQALELLGYEILIPSEGDIFNPNIHQATETLAMGDEYAGKIVAVHSIGIRKGAVLIHAADVAVAQ